MGSAIRHAQVRDGSLRQFRAVLGASYDRDMSDELEDHEGREEAQADGRRVLRLDDIKAKARADEERQGFTFQELRDHAHDEEWLDAHPGAREQIARAGEIMQKFRDSYKLPDDVMRSIREVSRRAMQGASPGVRDTTPTPIRPAVFDRVQAPAIDLGEIEAHPSHKTNEILETQVEVLQGLVLAQDEQLRLAKTEAEVGDARATEQSRHARRNLIVTALTLAATLLGIVVAIVIAVITS